MERGKLYTYMFLSVGAQVAFRVVFLQHRVDMLELNTLTEQMELPPVKLLIWAKRVLMCASE